MITADAENPYKRTSLSKGYLQGNAVDDLPKLRSESFFAAHGIEVWRDRLVTAVKPYEHSITFRMAKSSITINFCWPQAVGRVSSRCRGLIWTTFLPCIKLRTQRKF